MKFLFSLLIGVAVLSCLFVLDRVSSTFGLIVFNSVGLVSLVCVGLFGTDRLRAFGIGAAIPVTAVFFAAVQRSISGYESFQFGPPRTISGMLSGFSQLCEFWKAITLVAIGLTFLCGLTGVVVSTLLSEPPRS